VKKEFAVPPAVNGLSGRWTAEWQPAENERPSIEGQFLAPVGSLVADKMNRFKLLKSSFG
jgi:hypothetical protein